MWRSVVPQWLAARMNDTRGADIRASVGVGTCEAKPGLCAWAGGVGEWVVGWLAGELGEWMDG